MYDRFASCALIGIMCVRSNAGISQVIKGKSTWCLCLSGIEPIEFLFWIWILFCMENAVYPPAPWASQIYAFYSFTIELKKNNVRLWKLSYYISMLTRWLSGQGEICDIFSVNNHSFFMLVTYLMHVDVVDDIFIRM